MFIQQTISHVSESSIEYCSSDLLINATLAFASNESEVAILPPLLPPTVDQGLTVRALAHSTTYLFLMSQYGFLPKRLVLVP